MPRAGVYHTRAAASYWGSGQDSPRVDWANKRIIGAVAMLANVEALGWNLFTDDKSLAMAAMLSNRHTNGVAMRAGHPGMSENAYGAKFAVCKNFRVENGALRHDIEFLDAAAMSHYFHGTDPAEYVMTMAETHPDQIGESYVISNELVWTFADGTEAQYEGMYPPEPEDLENRPEGALTPMPVMRPQEVMFLDMVNEGALTHNGLFDAQNTAVMQYFAVGKNAEVSREAFVMLDELRVQMGIPLDQFSKKVQTFVGQYISSRGVKPMASDKDLRGNRAAFDGAAAIQPVDFGPGDEDEPVEGDEQPPTSDSGDEGSPEDSLDALEQQVDAVTAEAVEPAVEDAGEPAEIDSTLVASRFAELQQANTRLTRMVGKLVEAQAATNERLAKLEGEPTLTTQLGRQRTGGAAGQRQTPPKPAVMTKPVGSVSGRTDKREPTDADFANDPLKATFAAQVARQQPMIKTS